MGRHPTAAARGITAPYRRAPGRTAFELNEATGAMCDTTCRALARRDRSRTTALASGLGTRI